MESDARQAEELKNLACHASKVVTFEQGLKEARKSLDLLKEESVERLAWLKRVTKTRQRL